MAQDTQRLKTEIISALDFLPVESITWQSQNQKRNKPQITQITQIFNFF